jgi:hypothetical protein
VRLLKPRYAPATARWHRCRASGPCFDHGKPRANGALCIMLVRLRIAEIGEHTVAVWGCRRSGHQNRDCRTARSNRKTCPSHFDALRTVYDAVDGSSTTMA